MNMNGSSPALVVGSAAERIADLLRAEGALREALAQLDSLAARRLNRLPASAAMAGIAASSHKAIDRIVLPMAGIMPA